MPHDISVFAVAVGARTTLWCFQPLRAMLGDLAAVMPGRWRSAARLLVCVGLVTAVAGCALTPAASPPGPGVPRIARLQLQPERVTGLCPVTVRFEFEDADHDIVRAVAHVGHEERGKHEVLVLSAAPEAFVNMRNGTVVATVTPDRYGRHWIYAQVEDAAGHTSNVLEGVLLVGGPLPWAPRPCP